MSGKITQGNRVTRWPIHQNLAASLGINSYSNFVRLPSLSKNGQWTAQQSSCQAGNYIPQSFSIETKALLSQSSPIQTCIHDSSIYRTLVPALQLARTGSQFSWTWRPFRTGRLPCDNCSLVEAESRCRLCKQISPHAPVFASCTCGACGRTYLLFFKVVRPGKEPLQAHPLPLFRSISSPFGLQGKAWQISD